MNNPYTHQFVSTVEFEYSIRDYVRAQMLRMEALTDGPTYYNTINLDSNKSGSVWSVHMGSTSGETVYTKMEVLDKAVDAVIAMYNAKQNGKLSLLMAPEHPPAIQPHVIDGIPYQGTNEDGTPYSPPFDDTIPF